MTRVDWIVLRRIAARIGLVVTVFFGLMCLVESLDSWRFQTLSGIGGPMLALTAIVAGAGRSVIGTLPVTVLIGTIVGVLDLQTRREMTIIKVSGVSIWTVLRTPVLAAALLGVVVAFSADALAIQINRSLPTNGMRGGSNVVWLEQHGADGPYMMVSAHARADGAVLDTVSVFFTDPPTRVRLEAATAHLEPGEWVLSDVVRYRADLSPEKLPEVRLATVTTSGDMRVRLTSVRDLTFSELLSTVTQNVADPALRAAAFTSLLRLIALPGLLVGSVLIGFAFTSGYRRTNKYGGVVLYGIVLGFVLYVVTELANRSGFAGVLDPAFAALGPAFVAIVIGLTALLYREDGRA
jgi:lipopolysaccharide export system permease protein